MTGPQITVLTVVRNGSRYLSEALASIRAQSFEDWEHVIVDDASDDSSVEIVERAAAEDDRVRLVRRASSGGPYVAANDGLSLARGQYVARIDADDVATPERLEKQHRFLQQHVTMRACCGFHRGIAATGELFPAERRFPVSPGVLRWRLCMAADPAHSSAFVERDALHDIGGYAPLPLAQDWRMWCELSRRGWLAVFPEVVVYRRVHGERLSELQGPRQQKYAVDVAREHIRALSGHQWAAEDVHVLREVAHRRSAPLLDGVRVVDRWAALWRSDETLSASERAELGSWTKRLKSGHVRRWAESLPVTGSFVRAGTATGRRLNRLRVGVYAESRRRRKRSSSGSGSLP